MIGTDSLDQATGDTVAVKPVRLSEAAERLRMMLGRVPFEDAAFVFVASEVLDLVGAISGDDGDWRSRLLSIGKGKAPQQERRVRGWSSQEIVTLRRLRHAGYTQAEAAAVLGRTRKSVEHAEARAGGVFRFEDGDFDAKA